MDVHVSCPNWRSSYEAHQVHTPEIFVAQASTYTCTSVFQIIPVITKWRRVDVGRTLTRKRLSLACSTAGRSSGIDRIFQRFSRLEWWTRRTIYFDWPGRPGIHDAIDNLRMISWNNDSRRRPTDCGHNHARPMALDASKGLMSGRFLNCTYIYFIFETTMVLAFEICFDNELWATTVTITVRLMMNVNGNGSTYRL